MRKVYLFCSNGMSTSLMASKMQKVADEHNLPVEVKAFSDSLLEKIIIEQNPDAILLGPQVKHIYEKVVDRYGHLGKPIFVIDSEDYGNMNGERVLKKAILEMKKKKAESEGE
ncbi:MULTISPECIES: PTS sugar transporter subunit IIB [unclassified Bulleidia]|nr:MULTISPECIES: PTS sugar transporter subunit IIB [unclassified Bulleidia]QRG87500.1 PTS sugar transporter subunit IIB [Bulleidia sp. zg-1006]